MSFREKIALASFVTTVAAWGAYFTIVVVWTARGGPGAMLFWLFIVAAIAQAVLLAAATAFVALRAPGEANAARDERDRAVDRQASTIAYAVVVAALVGVIIWLHLGLDGTNTIFALIGVAILGEAARFGSQAIGYRAVR